MFTYRHVTAPTSGNRLSMLTLGPAEPTGDPVFLVHPINLRKECWFDMMRALAGERTCIAVDLAGHGESSDSDGYDIAIWVRDCVEAIEAIGLDRSHLVGGSLGGSIVVGISALLPDRIVSLTAMGSRISPAPPLPAKTDVPGLADLLAAHTVEETWAMVSPRSVGPNATAEVIDTVAYLSNAHGRNTITRIWEAAIVADAGPWVAESRCPSLILTGEFDATCPPPVGRAMAKELDGRFGQLTGLGHLPMVEAPATIMPLLTSHLTSAEAEVAR